MKSERRHELQHNILAGWLIETYQQIKPYQNAILGAALLVMVAIIAFMWWNRQSAAGAAEAWASMGRAMPLNTPADFEKVTERYPGSSAAHWAAMMAGDLYLADGDNNLFANKARGNEELTKAAQAYQAVLKEAQAQMLLEQATFGLARTRESQGRLDDAEKLYQQMTEKWPEGAFAEAATRRLQDIRKPDIRLFYDRFASFDPNAAAAKEAAATKKPLNVLPDNPPEEPTLKLHSPFGNDAEKKPDEKPPTRPDEKTTAKPDEKTTAKPEEKTTVKPDEKTTKKSEEKSTAKPEEKTTEKPADKAAAAPPAPETPAKEPPLADKAK
jgi:tetratricopeptide (TPR) repeat protein